MKVLPFTIPVPGEKNIIVQQESLPFFYPHLHRHEEIQLTWIQRGEGILVVGNNMHPFRSNEIYCIGANQPHVFKTDPESVEANDAESVQSMTLFFNPAGKLATTFELAELKTIRSFLQQHRSGFAIPEHRVPDISALMSRVSTQGGIDQFIAFLSLWKKISQIPDLQELSAYAEMKGVSELEGIRLGKIYHYILENYASQITLEDVAAQAHMTTQAFCRYFKKHTRHTFVSFLNEVRINEACKKLTDGGFESIATIAYSCGFNSITNFNRVFKSITGKSPSEYAEAYQRGILAY